MPSKLCPFPLFLFLEGKQCAGLLHLVPLILYPPVRAHIVLLRGFLDVWLAPKSPVSLCHNFLDCFFPSQVSLLLLSLSAFWNSWLYPSGQAKLCRDNKPPWYFCGSQELFSDLFPFLMHVNSRLASVLFYVIFILGLRLEGASPTCDALVTLYPREKQWQNHAVAFKAAARSVT